MFRLSEGGWVWFQLRYNVFGLIGSYWSIVMQLRASHIVWVWIIKYYTPRSHTLYWAVSLVHWAHLANALLAFPLAHWAHLANFSLAHWEHLSNALLSVLLGTLSTPRSALVSVLTATLSSPENWAFSLPHWAHLTTERSHCHTECARHNISGEIANNNELSFWLFYNTLLYWNYKYLMEALSDSPLNLRYMRVQNLHTLLSNTLERVHCYE